MNTNLNIRLILTVFASVLFFLNSCSGDSDRYNSENGNLSGRLVITGSSTVAPLASEIGKRFESSHPRVRIDVQTGGSSRGISDTRHGIADIGMASRALSEEESDLLAFPVARDGISVILHKDNPVTQLSDGQIKDIYTGKITDWSEVGGDKAPITVVNKAEGRATLELFLKYFGLKNSEIKAQVIIGDNEQGIKTVAGNPSSIGYVSIGTAEYDEGIGVPIKLLPIGGTEATLENVQNGSFPLSRPLNLITKSRPEVLSRLFIEFARSGAVNDIIKEQYFAPVQN